ncbi:MAG: YihA family ribosome biogenesis GTP-binding protein [Rhodospirillales bacterium]|nr:YihA family ribosome biogenesis GTP-binding protein [Rhodospirillales bacterium]
MTPQDPTPEQLEAGRHLFAQECRFVMSAATLEGLPEPGLTEIAFAGRSNVGKSSLINALTGRKTLARTSNTPGRTQMLNFFRQGTEQGPALMLVDLPGFVYARASKTDIAHWNRLVNTYLKGRPNLRRICLLVDSRHGLKDPDREVMAMLDTAAVSYQVVLTKADKLKGGALAGCLETVAKELATRVAAHPEIIATSAEKGDGVPELRAALAALADHG